jgi:hypothetical protein
MNFFVILKKKNPKDKFKGIITVAEITSVTLKKKIIGKNILRINYAKGKRIFELKGDKITIWF